MLLQVSGRVRTVSPHAFPALRSISPGSWTVACDIVSVPLRESRRFQAFWAQSGRSVSWAFFRICSSSSHSRAFSSFARGKSFSALPVLRGVCGTRTSAFSYPLRLPVSGAGVPLHTPLHHVSRHESSHV